MCDTKCVSFAGTAIEKLKELGFLANRILEVGSYDVNGSARDMLVSAFSPLEYLGVDIKDGPKVDKILSVYDLVSELPGAYDLVVTTEMLEHVEFWDKAFLELKAMVREGGWILITTRAPGFQRHDYPSDYWRYTEDFMRASFADFDVVLCEEDRPSQGVFLLARKPEAYVPLDLSGMEPERI